MGIPIMSNTLMLADGFDETPAALDEKRKHYNIGEVDWSGTDVLVVDMPPGTWEEVRGLLQLGLSIAVVVTVPQLISESAVREVVEMAQEYRLPLLGVVENQQNDVTGEACHRLATHYGLPLLVQIPWSPDIPMSMHEHVPFDQEGFLAVAEALTARLFPASEVQSPPTSEEEDLLRRAEAWASGEQWAAPAPPTQAPGVFVADDLSADEGTDERADIGGEPWTEYYELRPAVNLARGVHLPAGTVLHHA